MKSMLRFFDDGDKVKVTLRFRGREMAHQDLGYKLMQKVKERPPRSQRWNSSPRSKAAR